MKSSLKLKTVAWIMLLLGILYVYSAFLIMRRDIYTFTHYGKTLIFENLFMGAVNIILGIGLLKPQKWAVWGAVIFGGFGFFLYLAKLTFFGGFRFILLQIFYALVVYFTVLQAKQFRPNK
jgi:hypothetical protein